MSRRAGPVGKDVQYDITVHRRGSPALQYRTKAVLSNVGAEAIRGRGTRVWKAVQLVNGVETGPPVALKDCWVDSDRMREGEILDKIRGSVTDPRAAQVISRCLLSVACYADVLVEDEVDTTDKLHRRGAPIPANHGRLPLKLRADTIQADSKPVVNATPTPEQRGHVTTDSVSFLAYSPKTHHRIVFEEIGVPIYQVESLPKVFNALRQLVIGELLLFSRRYVMRM